MAKAPSVLRCLEEAVLCGSRAAAAADESDVLRHLEMAAVWLEMARSRARSGDPSAWGEGAAYEPARETR